MSDSVRPHRQQPTRLPCPWDSPGKNTRVGCHFLLQCMTVDSESEVAQLCLTLSDPMDCSLPGSSVHWIFHARVLEWGAIAFSITRGQKTKTGNRNNIITKFSEDFKKWCTSKKNLKKIKKNKEMVQSGCCQVMAAVGTIDYKSSPQ